MENLNQKVAVITGGAEGIGKALAMALAAEGAKLVLADINTERLDATVKELAEQGAEVFGVTVDVSQSAQVDALADAAFERFGAVHILINNAGVAMAKNAWETTEQDWNAFRGTTA